MISTPHVTTPRQFHLRYDLLRSFGRLPLHRPCSLAIDSDQGFHIRVHGLGGRHLTSQLPEQSAVEIEIAAAM